MAAEMARIDAEQAKMEADHAARSQNNPNDLDKT
jgi:hypothetical protein